MSSLKAGTKWTTKLSSAGLVYLHFGHRVIAEVTASEPQNRLVDLLYDKMYENFIEEVDGIDNGIDAHVGTPRWFPLTSLYITCVSYCVRAFDKILLIQFSCV